MHIAYVSKLHWNHISSHLFHYIAQTLNGFISKRRFGEIAPIPEQKKSIISLISILEIHRSVHTNKTMYSR